MVKINNFRQRPGSCGAFEPKFLGPYRISRVLGDLNYHLEAPNLKPEMVHYNRMSHYHTRNEQVLPNQQAEVVSHERSISVLPSLMLLEIPEPDPFFVSIIHNPILRTMKIRSAKSGLNINPEISVSDEFFRPSSIFLPDTVDNTLAIVPYEPTRNQLEITQANDNITIEVIPLVNDKGKIVIPCRNCGKLFEQKTGMRVHLYSCRIRPV